jgi:hypothetical protein
MIAPELRHILSIKIVVPVQRLFVWHTQPCPINSGDEFSTILGACLYLNLALTQSGQEKW